jgi:hypothetical protein
VIELDGSDEGDRFHELEPLVTLQMPITAPTPAG